MKLLSVKKALFVTAVVLLTVLNSWVFLTAQGLEKTLLDVGYYHAVLEKIDGEVLQNYFLEEGISEFDSNDLFDEPVIEKAMRGAVAEDWLKAQAADAVEKYILFIKGDSESLNVTVDLLERREVFLEKFKIELINYYPALRKEEIFIVLDELLAQFEIPEEITLVDIGGYDKQDPSIHAELVRLTRARSTLHIVPWVCFAGLAGLSLAWFKLVKTLKILGLAVLLSGATYPYLWPHAWDIFAAPYVKSLTENHRLLALIWANAGKDIVMFTGTVFSEAALILAGAGLALFMAGLVASYKQHLLPVKGKH